MAGRYHIIIDVTGASNDILNNHSGLTDFLNKLPKVIGMNILHGPTVIQGIPENPGLSGFVIIDFSHISIHTFTKSNQALVDIFSCKPYDQEVASQAVLGYFQVSKEQCKIKEVFWE